LTSFISERVKAGGYPNADAFVADLLRSEAGTMSRIDQGEAIPVDAHFDRRLEAMLDEAAESGDYALADRADFDQMEREALAMLSQRGPAQ
jgi:Arc/MetJ-type ribon-helix-helix transcriptional regulator